MDESINKNIIITVVIIIALAAVFYFGLNKYFAREEVVVAEASNVSSSISGTIISVDKQNKKIVVEADEKQTIPAGTKRTLSISANTVMQKIEPREKDQDGYVLSAKFEKIEFENLAVGQKILARAPLDVNIADKDNLSIDFINIFIGDF